MRAVCIGLCLGPITMTVTGAHRVTEAQIDAIRRIGCIDGEVERGMQHTHIRDTSTSSSSIASMTFTAIGNL